MQANVLTIPGTCLLLYCPLGSALKFTEGIFIALLIVAESMVNDSL